MSDMKVTDRRWWARGSGTSDAAAEAAEAARTKPTYIEDLEERLETKDREIAELLGRYRAATDEFDQARARLRKEVSRDVERGRRALLVSFLEILDNLDRALVAACDRPDDPLVKGVSLVQQQFVATLEGLGVVRVNPLGDAFDPTRHEAVATVDAGPDVPDGQIVGVVKPGYLIGDDVLRPAMVAVATPTL